MFCISNSALILRCLIYIFLLLRGLRLIAQLLPYVYLFRLGLPLTVFSYSHIFLCCFSFFFLGIRNNNVAIFHVLTLQYFLLRRHFISLTLHPLTNWESIIRGWRKSIRPHQLFLTDWGCHYLNSHLQQLFDRVSFMNAMKFKLLNYLGLVWFGCLGLWHINLCRLFNAKSIFM